MCCLIDGWFAGSRRGPSLGSITGPKYAEKKNLGKRRRGGSHGCNKKDRCLEIIVVGCCVRVVSFSGSVRETAGRET